MKVRVEFDLCKEKEIYDHSMAGYNYYNKLQDISNYIRNKLKYEDVDNQTAEYLREIRNIIFEIE